MKKILCYVAIVLLIMLIVLPPALRIFVKDDYEDEAPKDVMELLTCTKNDESINMPYVNGKITMIRYSFKEPIDINNELDENVDNENEQDDVEQIETIKSVMERINNTQKETINGEVTYKLQMNDSNSLQVPEKYKRTSQVMKNYYTNLGYKCNIIK